MLLDIWTDQKLVKMQFKNDTDATKVHIVLLIFDH